MEHLGYHRGCGGEVVLKVYRGVRVGFWDRFAEPDEELVKCLECGETDLPDEEIAESLAEVIDDAEDAGEG